MADPKHIENYETNQAEILRLIEIHEQLTGTGPGRRHNVQILNKSAVVLLTAAWEAFVEDLAEGALEFMIAEAPDHTIFPPLVLERIGSLHQGIKAWDLAGPGWQKALRDNLKEILARTTGTLNAPKTARVNELFEKTIGFRGLSTAWRWSGSNSATASAKLDALVALRGEIAHRVAAAREVRKSHVSKATELILRIGAASSNAVRAYVQSRTGKSPWIDYAPIL